MINDKILLEAARMYGTPLYIFDLDQLKRRVNLMKARLMDGHAENRYRICYAMKANPFLIGPLREVVDGFEVCSPGEYRICERAGIGMEKIVLSGVYKEEKDILHAMEVYGDKGTYTIESMEHLRLLEKCAAKTGIRIHALIRVTSGNQFGVDEEDICKIIEQREDYSHIHIKGLQHYAGTQKKKTARMEEELQHLDDFLKRLYLDYQYEAEELEYGPGLFVPYFVNDKEWDDELALEELKEKLGHLNFKGRITLEMGRYIAAYCGYYLTSIVDQKKNHGQNYCIVDGGINHLTYAGQTMGMKLPYIKQVRCLDGKAEVVSTSWENEAKDSGSGDREVENAKVENSGSEGDKGQAAGCERWNICGSLCTVNDVIVKQLPLCDAALGDMLVFERTGAYTVTEGMYLFLSRDLPGVAFWSEEEGLKIVREHKHVDGINSADVQE